MNNYAQICKVNTKRGSIYLPAEIHKKNIDTKKDISETLFSLVYLLPGMVWN